MKNLIFALLALGTASMNAVVGMTKFTVTNTTKFDITLTAKVEEVTNSGFNFGTSSKTSAKKEEVTHVIHLKPAGQDGASHTFDFVFYGGSDSFGATSQSLKELKAEVDFSAQPAHPHTRIGILIPQAATLDKIQGNGVDIKQEGPRLEFVTQEILY